jgi:hypothetical protein
LVHHHFHHHIKQHLQQPQQQHKQLLISDALIPTPYIPLSSLGLAPPIHPTNSTLISTKPKFSRFSGKDSLPTVNAWILLFEISTRAITDDQDKLTELMSYQCGSDHDMIMVAIELMLK